MKVDGGSRGGSNEDYVLSKVLIVVSHNSALYQSLARTLEEQIRGCSTRVCETTSSAADIEEEVQLILLHQSGVYDANAEIDAYRAAQPNVSIALVVDDCDLVPPQCLALFEAQKVQGILPLTLKLEIWLAAVSLMISGGEYYPAQRRRITERTQEGAHAEPQERRTLPDRDCAMLSMLTNREQQILELLSEGYQNKLIAHKMSLSEHTVKVHVHNLLSKLHVSNRTQAAARYRRDMPEPARKRFSDIGTRDGYRL